MIDGAESKQHPIIRIKRVYAPAAPDDGTRVLIDRLWPRGLTRERAQVDLWLKEIAPSAELRRWFAHDPAKFDAFRQRYLTELATVAPAQLALTQLRELAARGPLTLLFGAHDEAHNDAVVLRDLLTSSDHGG